MTAGVALSVSIAACGAHRAAPSSPSRTVEVSHAATSGAGTVSGTVIGGLQDLPLLGRSVAIGPVHTTTDDTGHFSIPGAPSTYDLVIVDPDGTTVSLYVGLTRREVLVRHHRSAADVTAPARRSVATVTLSGGPPWPLRGDDNGGVWIVSPAAKSHVGMGGSLPGIAHGPDVGLRLGWDGPPSIAGEVYAWVRFHNAEDAGSGDAGASSSFAFGEQPLTIEEGAVSVSLSLHIVSQTANVNGTITYPPNSPPTQKSVYYPLPSLPGARVPVAGDTSHAASFDYRVPVLHIPGSSLCFDAFSSTGWIAAPLLLGSVCGITPDAPASVHLQAPPKFISPATSSKVTPTTTFSWTPFEGGVYELDLKSQPATAGAPDIHVYTSATSTNWPDLRAVYVPFPAEGDYECTVVGLGVFASIDQLCGPAGFAATGVPDFRRSYLPPVKVSVSR
jgi:hypothetical protein